MKHKTIPYHIYPFEVLVIINPSSHEEVSSLLKEVLPEDVLNEITIDGTYKARTTLLSSNQTVIIFNDTNPSIIVHEVFHAISFLFERIELKLSYKSNEAYAYAMQYLFEQITSFINE